MGLVVWPTLFTHQPAEPVSFILSVSTNELALSLQSDTLIRTAEWSLLGVPLAYQAASATVEGCTQIFSQGLKKAKTQ